MMKSFLYFIACLGTALSAAAQYSGVLESPGKKLSVWLTENKGTVRYSIMRGQEEVIQSSQLGIVLQGERLDTALRFSSLTPIKNVAEKYSMVNAKKAQMEYRAAECTWEFVNAQNSVLAITFSVSDEWVAFRYKVKKAAGSYVEVSREATTFSFDTHARSWLQPVARAKSGWEQTNPSYEEEYQMNKPVGLPSVQESGWVYPALFKTGNNWVLITEAGLDSSYCGTRLGHLSAGGVYSVAMPNAREVIMDKQLLPRSYTGSLQTPWRILVIGSLATIVESTAGTDLAAPAAAIPGFVKPGKASWSWINSKDDFIVYEEQKKYIDYAADMQWQYCLVDADWDRKIGYEKIAELAAYADSKKVGLLVWYNSAGDWNTVPYTPKNKLLTQNLREQEFSRLQKMGIKGIKVDFMGGDGQSAIKYYFDILQDAARYNLMVNFHGATLPRGWARTYPNLLTVEAVKGFEMVTFGQPFADSVALHCTMLPFTRNAFDPMDFTPMNLNKLYTQVQRRTTSSFELATSVLFLSGIQHFAESPEGMALQPAFIKDFLRKLPTGWDDLRFVAGYPGSYVVIARKKGDNWYVAGINGEKEPVRMELDLGFVKNKKGSMFTTNEKGELIERGISPRSAAKMQIAPRSGFVMVF